MARRRRRRSGRTKATGHDFEGRISDEAHLRDVLEQAQRAGVVTQFDCTISADPWASVVWFRGHPGRAFRQVRDSVRGLVERRSGTGQNRPTGANS